MKRIFKKISVFLVAIVAVIGIAGVKKVSAEAVTQQYKDVLYDTTSTSIADGWEVVGLSSNSVFGTSSVGKLAAGGTITSPAITGTATSVTISILVGTTGTSNAAGFTINALLSGAVVGTTGAFTPTAKALNLATTVASGSVTSFTIEATAINAIQISNTYTKQINVAQIDVSYTLASGDVDYDALAIDAIAAIGTVTYTEASKNKIDAATAALSLCDSPSGATISNYETYESALTDFSNLESAAITEYSDAVALISGTDSTAYTNIQAAIAKYNVLFGDALTNATVVNTKTNFDQKENAYWAVNAVSYATQSIISSSNGATGNTTGVRVGSSIFFLGEGASIDTNNKRALPDGTTATNRIKLNGSLQYNSGNGKNGVKFTAESAGKVVVYVGTSKASNYLTLAKMSGALTTVDQSSAIITQDTTNAGNAEEFILNVPEAGTYFIGGSAQSCDVYYINFMAYNVTLGNQVGVIAEANDAARFVAKLENIDLSDITSISLAMTLNYYNVTSTDEIWDIEDAKEAATLTSSQNISTVYSSITGLSDSLGASEENTLWTAYVVTGLSGFNRQDAVEPLHFYEFSNIVAVITITLADGTELTATTTTTASFGLLNPLQA